MNSSKDPAELTIVPVINKDPRHNSPTAEAVKPVVLKKCVVASVESQLGAENSATGVAVSPLSK